MATGTESWRGPVPVGAAAKGLVVAAQVVGLADGGGGGSEAERKLVAGCGWQGAGEVRERGRLELPPRA